MITRFLEDLSSPSLNTEKMIELHNKIHPYVPGVFQDKEIYAAPSEHQEGDTKGAKQACRGYR